MEKIIAFMNAFSQGSSGSDIAFIEIAKRMFNYRKLVVTSASGRELIRNNGLDAEFLITTKEKEFNNVIWIYLKRLVMALRLKIEVAVGDVLLGTSDNLPDVLPIFFLKLRNKDVVWVQHIFHLVPVTRILPFIAQRFSFEFIKLLADVIIVDNLLLMEGLKGFGFKKEKLKLNYLGVRDIGEIETVRKDYDAVFLGRLKESKGVYTLLCIWGLVLKKLPDARLGIIGTGPAEVESRLRKMVKDKGLESNVKFLGFLENEKAFKTVQSGKIFVLPSFEEGFGLVGIEAQALGLPVVAWKLPAFNEVFPIGMVKLSLGEENKFAEKITNLLTNKVFYKKIQEEALENSKRFSWDRTAERELRYINEYCA